MNRLQEKPKNVCMIAYTNYAIDARVRREAETLAAIPEYRVTVLVNKQKAQPRDFVLDNVEVKELNIAKYRGNSSIRYCLSYLQFLLLAFFRCNMLLWSKSIDIVHIHNMPNFLVYAAIIPKLCGKKIVLDIHDTVLETYSCKFQLNSLKWNLLRTLLKMEEYLSCLLADRIICVNHVQLKVLLSRGVPESKVTVILNVPDPKRFPYVFSQDRQPDQSNGFKLVYFGTIAERLGLDLAIQAVANLTGKIPGLQFHIIGDGDQKEELVKLTRELRVKDAVHFSKGSVPLDELTSHLKHMDLTIIPNKRSIATDLMLPVKMLESIALGIPVVTARLEAINHYFQDDAVFYFEPDNLDSLTASILEAYSNPTSRTDRCRSARSFLTDFGWDVHKLTLVNLYKSLS